MRKMLLVLALAAIAIFGGSANAADTVGAGTFESHGDATQVNETEGEEAWSVEMTGGIAGLLEADLDSAEYDCTLTANGTLDNPIPDDNPIWTVECANEDTGDSLTMDLIGGNRPLTRSGVSLGMSIIEIGGPAAINGDLHGHVATCRGLVNFPSISMACVIL